jgi:hypothetical protein
VPNCAAAPRVGRARGISHRAWAVLVATTLAVAACSTRAPTDGVANTASGGAASTDGGASGDAATVGAISNAGPSCSDGAPPCFQMTSVAGPSVAFTCCAPKSHCVGVTSSLDTYYQDVYYSCVPECASGAECESGVCGPTTDTSFATRNLCLTPSCSDGVRNGDESDVDCGGSCAASFPSKPPKACAVGETCTKAADCVTQSCGTDGHCLAPSCVDGVKNGDESDMDCGGPCPDKCKDGAACVTVNDCTSGNCDSSLCYPTTCRDGRRDGDESDVDCGGSCPKCGVARACTSDADCDHGRCQGVSDGGKVCFVFI